MAHPHVLIVGAGIVGAAIAQHLARGGARVTILDAAEPGGVATRQSLAWINASWGHREDYFRLRVRAMAEWRRLAAALPALPLSWCGGLLWDLPPARLAAFADDHARWGYDLRLVDAAGAERIEPALAAPPALAVHAPVEGAVEPLEATQVLLADAVANGAQVIAGRPVRSLESAGGRVVAVRCDDARLAADSVVIAAGVGSAALAATVGVDLRVDASPALLVTSRPTPPILCGLVLAPALHARQARDGRVVASASAGRGDGEDACRSTFGDLQRMLVGGEALVLESWASAIRPIPADGRPIVGSVDGIAGLHLAVTHSGITLAPAIGRFLAEEILAGDRHPLLAPFRPSDARGDMGITETPSDRRGNQPASGRLNGSGGRD